MGEPSGIRGTDVQHHGERARTQPVGDETANSETGGPRFVTTASQIPGVAPDGPGQRSTFDQAVTTSRASTATGNDSKRSVLPAFGASLGPIQSELRRLKLLVSANREDGIPELTPEIEAPLDLATRDALIEAFGGDEWRQLSPVEILARLRAAPPPPAQDHVTGDITGDAPAGARPRYGKMFADGVLDVTLALGLEDPIPYATVAQNLAELGLARNDVDGATLLASIGKGEATGPLFVRRGAIDYKPPAGAQRSVDLVVRLLLSDGKNGRELASQFQDGMSTSDATVYSGHGGYGTGPDFDSGVLFNLRKEDGTWRKVKDVGDLTWVVHDMNDFERRIADGSLVVDPQLDGNVLLNQQSPRNELAAEVLNWLNAKVGAVAATGAGGTLDKSATDHDQDDYRLLALIGCNTKDYRAGLRSTPGYDKRQTDLIDVDSFGSLGHQLPTAMAFLQGLLNQSSANQLTRAIRTAHGDEDIIRNEGFKDNPRDARSRTPE